MRSIINGKKFDTVVNARLFYVYCAVFFFQKFLKLFTSLFLVHFILF